ncbi:MAG: phosphate ABC transporter permease PstA [Sporichthyaceae bacterium]
MTIALERPAAAWPDVPSGPLHREPVTYDEHLFREVPPPPTTYCPPVRPADGESPEPRRVIGKPHLRDILAIGGAMLAAYATTVLLFTFIAPFSGKIGFAVVGFTFFLAFYALLVATEEAGPAVRDRVVMALVHGIAFLLLLALIFVVGYTFKRAAPALAHVNFFTKDLGDAGPLEPLDVGGIKHAVIGTLWMISIALAITIPLGITCALYLNEVRGPFTRFVRTIVEAMTALPSIVAGLFIYAFWIIILGQGKSGFAAALAISVMMLPIIIRAADVVLRLVPGNLKEASLALGAGQWRTSWHVVLPTSRSGLATAVILGTARGIGETSPVLLTAGYTALSNSNPTSGPMVSLPLAAFQLVRSPQESYIARGFGAGATLLALVLILFILARIIGGRGPGNLTKHQQKKLGKASEEDVARYARRAAGIEPAEDPHQSAARRLLSHPVLATSKARIPQRFRGKK